MASPQGSCTSWPLQGFAKLRFSYDRSDLSLNQNTLFLLYMDFLKALALPAFCVNQIQLDSCSPFGSMTSLTGGQSHALVVGLKLHSGLSKPALE